MVTYFLDTSALIKRYLPEAGSGRMVSLFQEGADIVISELTMVEFLSVLQKLRFVSKAIDDDSFREIWNAFSLDVAYGAIQVHTVSPEVVEEGIQFLLGKYVTAVDVLHLGTARLLGDDMVFVSSDRKLNQLAAALGMRYLDPTVEA